MLPRVTCHMVSSLDGKLIPSRWTPLESGRASDVDVDVYVRLKAHFDAEASLVGRQTAETDYGVGRYELQHNPAKTTPVPYRAPHNSSNWLVVVDAHGRLAYESAQLAGDDVITVLSEETAPEYLEHLQAAGVSYVFAGQDGRDLARALTTLRELFDIERLVIMGGGVINGAFLDQGLIDEFSILIHPGVDGSADSPSFLEGRTNEQEINRGITLEHVSTQTLEEGLVWLRYEVRKRQMSPPSGEAPAAPLAP